MKQRIYPVEPWHVTETGFSAKTNYRNETTFALSNGYIGTRGTQDECYDFDEATGLEGNFINGFYESVPVRYGEWNYGFPEQSQSLLNLPNAKPIRVAVDGETFDLRASKVESYHRRLDMQRGCVERSLVWVTDRGKRVQLDSGRFVSLADKNLMAMYFQVTLLDGCGEVMLQSVLNAAVQNHTRTANPLVDYGPFGPRLLEETLQSSGGTVFYQGQTKGSKLMLACGAGHSLRGAAAHCREEVTGSTAIVSYTFDAVANTPVMLEKYIAYTSSLDMPKESLQPFTEQKLREAYCHGYEALFKQHTACMERFWQAADITIQGDDELQQGLRFNLFHIMQAAGRDGRTGLGAKGLSGEGYEGHFFWDTEIYVLPVFTYTSPELAKGLLDYRYNTLDEARARARVLGHPTGALYPWRTINGSEASTYFPLGTAQYHINADIAYAFAQYVRVTGDYEYLANKAAEVLVETARVWADVGCFSETRGGQYCICSVTGPDEYNALVDNNFYTNLMARENLRDALWALGWLAKNRQGPHTALLQKLEVSEEETAHWQNVADNMYLPFDEPLGVYLQDDGFLLRKPWDDSRIPPEKRHLLYENYHPLFIWRQRMAKQADSILGMHLHRHLFTREELEKNYDYYQSVTLHHSSLSTCVFGMVASAIGRQEEAYGYFADSARMDLDDHHNNFYAGIHAANMAGTWQALVHGFAGLRAERGFLQLAPHLPAAWQGYSFCFVFQGRQLRLLVNSEGWMVTLLKGEKLEIEVAGKSLVLDGEGACVHGKTL